GTYRRVAHVVSRVLEERGVQADIHVASNPEFLREGLALHDALYPERIVVGTESEAALRVMEEFYNPILLQSFAPPACVQTPRERKRPTFLVTDPTSAEMIKYASNAFLATKISFANEIAGLCERVGADVVQVTRGMGLDSRIGPSFLGAGLGWGGSCLPKDTAALIALAAEYGYEMPITQAARSVNAQQRRIAVEKLQEALKVLRGRTIGVLGLAFKPGTDDVRESAALEIIRLLVERGAHVKAHDPVAMDNARAALADLEVVSRSLEIWVSRNFGARQLQVGGVCWKAANPFATVWTGVSRYVETSSTHRFDHPATRIFLGRHYHHRREHQNGSAVPFVRSRLPSQAQQLY